MSNVFASDPFSSYPFANNAQAGIGIPGRMFANLSGAGSVVADLSSITAIEKGAKEYTELYEKPLRQSAPVLHQLEAAAAGSSFATAILRVRREPVPVASPVRHTRIRILSAEGNAFSEAAGSVSVRVAYQAESRALGSSQATACVRHELRGEAAAKSVLKWTTYVPLEESIGRSFSITAGAALVSMRGSSCGKAGSSRPLLEARLSVQARRNKEQEAALLESRKHQYSHRLLCLRRG